MQFFIRFGEVRAPWAKTTRLNWQRELEVVPNGQRVESWQTVFLTPALTHESRAFSLTSNEALSSITSIHHKAFTVMNEKRVKLARFLLSHSTLGNSISSSHLRHLIMKSCGNSHKKIISIKPPFSLVSRFHFASSLRYSFVCTGFFSTNGK